MLVYSTRQGKLLITYLLGLLTLTENAPSATRGFEHRYYGIISMLRVSLTLDIEPCSGGSYVTPCMLGDLSYAFVPLNTIILMYILEFFSQTRLYIEGLVLPDCFWITRDHARLATQD